MELVFENLFNLELQQVIMWLIGGILIYLAIKRHGTYFIITHWFWCHTG